MPCTSAPELDLLILDRGVHAACVMAIKIGPACTWKLGDFLGKAERLT